MLTALINEKIRDYIMSQEVFDYIIKEGPQSLGQLPVMDGFALTAEIRKNKSKDEIAVIGMSAAGNPVLSARFLQNGANDFVRKPYHEEEFAWRINQNIEMLDNIMKLKDAAVKDHLTGLYNRRNFFNAAEKFYENAKRDISVGLTTRLGACLEDMLKEADDLLYQAKAAGRNRVVLKLSP